MQGTLQSDKTAAPAGDDQWRGIGFLMPNLTLKKWPAKAKILTGGHSFVFRNTLKACVCGRFNEF